MASAAHTSGAASLELVAKRGGRIFQHIEFLKSLGEGLCFAQLGSDAQLAQERY